MRAFGDTTGAFADGAVLFPLMVALSATTGMNSTLLLAAAGVAYVAAGLIFRVPMPVQPLKSVAVAALALGASAHEIAAAGFTVGALCLLLSLGPVDALAARVPRHLVHGLQMALGLLLVWKGSGWGFAGASSPMMIAFVLTVLGILAASHAAKLPLLGWVATAALGWGVWRALGDTPAPSSSTAVADGSLRLPMVVSLVLPQMALTLTNSVVGTQQAAQSYFGEAAHRVTAKRLLVSIGLGNLLCAPLGGLPFCHGSGGITAHVKGGARTWHMNLIIGATLLALAGTSWVLGVPVVPAYPTFLMAALLVGTGAFHVLLAKPSFAMPSLRWQFVIMGAVTIATQNMLWVLVSGVACHLVQTLRQRTT